MLLSTEKNIEIQQTFARTLSVAYIPVPKFTIIEHYVNTVHVHSYIHHDNVLSI